MCCPDNGAALAIKERKDSGMLYIGVDLGTSAVKLLLMAADGKYCIEGVPPLFSPSGLVAAEPGRLVESSGRRPEGTDGGL